LRDDTRAFFGIDVGDQPVGNCNQQPIDLDGDDGGVTASTDTRGTSTTASGKRVSAVWSGLMRSRMTSCVPVPFANIAVRGILLDPLVALGT
jgi:hypothetical protein